MKKGTGRKIAISIGIIIALIIALKGSTIMKALGYIGIPLPYTEKWKEEVQLSDGRVIVVKRESQLESGGGEWPQKGWGLKPKEYRMRFADPDGSGKTMKWHTLKKPETWPEIPLILDKDSGHFVIFTIVGIAPGCEAYCKYVYRDGAWVEEQLPETFEPRKANLIVGGSKNKPRFIDLETKLRIIKEGRYRWQVTQAGPTRKVCN